MTDAEWELVRTLFETYRALTRGIRALVDGRLYLGAEGCRWRPLPKDFGPWQAVRGYRDRFRRDGVWADVAARPARRGSGAVDRDRGRAGRHLGTTERRARRGRGQGGKGIKRRLPTRSFGFAPAVPVPANLHDTPGLEPPLERAAEAGRDRRRAKVDAADAGPGGGRPARRRRPGVAPRPRRPGLRALAGPVADRGHVRRAHEPLPPPDREPRAERRGGRGRDRDGQPQARSTRLDPLRSQSRPVIQALRLIFLITPDRHPPSG
jgi:transposase